MTDASHDPPLRHVEMELDTAYALEDVVIERRRQDRKWGQQNHDPFCWMTVLMEEVGEAAQVALRMRFGGPDLIQSLALREELIQVAAVAVAAVECLDRQSWDWADAPKLAPEVSR